MRFIGTAVVGALLSAGITACASQDVAAPTSQDATKAWRRLPDAPLSPRNHAVVVGVGGRMLVVGGWEYLCPPTAECAYPEEPLLDDGAVYDRATDSWRGTAPAPFG